jgi:phosphoribosylanthranilate isomerase
MEASSRPRIKVCCIQDEAEAWTAIRLGASALGLVSAMPSGPGVIPEPTIARVAARVPPGVATFLLTSLQGAAAIAEQQRRLRTGAVQMVDSQAPDSYASLRAALPGIGLVQVVHVRGPESVEEALALARHVDALLLDSGNPGLAVKELGGTGRRHDWSISRRIREAVSVPVYLAGGLRPENVAEAIESVGPFGLDLCTGVRSEGRLDPAKLERFVGAAWR